MNQQEFKIFITQRWDHFKTKSLENKMNIHVGYTPSNPLSVDTNDDLEEVKKIMEKKV